MKNVKDPLFIIHTAITDIILSKLNTTILSFQSKNISIGKVNNTLKKLIENINDDNIFLEIQQLIQILSNDYKEIINTEIQNTNLENQLIYIKHTSKSFSQAIATNITQRFTPNETISRFYEVFSPIGWNGGDVMKNKRIAFAKCVKHFRTLFVDWWYKQKFNDFHIIQNIIKSNLSEVKDFEAVCYFIMKDHRFKPAVTAVKLAQIGMLIPGSSAVVEGGFSIRDDIQDDSRNRLSTAMLNNIMICKISITNDIRDLIFQEASLLWLKGEKRRRGLNQVYCTLYGKGILNSIKEEKKPKWMEKEEEEEKNEEEDKMTKEKLEETALFMIQDEEENPEKTTDGYIVDDETIDSSNDDCTSSKFLSKKKKKKEKNYDDVNEEDDTELKAIQAAQTAKTNKYLLKVNENTQQ
jgi:hypothetical protein